MNKPLAMVMENTNLKQLAKDLGITYSQDNVICYPNQRTKSAFMTACYGNYAQAYELIKERKKSC
ncbi:hypothetical protein VPHD518_0089 [Vibrio phage D518]